MTEYFLDGLKKLSSFRAYSVPNPCGIAAFGHRDVQSEFLAQELSEKLFRRRPRRTALRAFNAQGAQNGGDGLVRVSFSPFNRKREIDVLLSALKKMN